MPIELDLPVDPVLAVTLLNPRAQFLEEVKRITDFQTTAVPGTDAGVTYTAESVNELIHARVNQTAIDILSVIDHGGEKTEYGYHLIPVGDSEKAPLSLNEDIAGELGTMYFDLINT